MMSSKTLSVCTFYSYSQIEKEKLIFLKKNLTSKGEFESIRGLILLSDEGINATLVGSLKKLKRYLKIIKESTGIPIQGKWQFSDRWGYKALRIKIKNEIINSGKKDLKSIHSETHLNPEEWNKILNSKEPITILDIRNNYETQIGKFKNAVDLNLKEFKDFSQKLKTSSLHKGKKTLIYCTGGIRCEKALAEMKNQGFNNVKQLTGGILNYLSYFPHSQFDGECFVFDHRISLNQKLKPSNSHQLCPHCGQPGNVKINCLYCRQEGVICDLCQKKSKTSETCSKNCSYHYKLGHFSKRKEKDNKKEKKSTHPITRLFS